MSLLACGLNFEVLYFLRLVKLRPTWVLHQEAALLSLMYIVANTCWLTNLACRPHPNECSGGDLDGDLFFLSWDKDLIPCQTEAPMDYTGRRPRIMDHKVTLEVILNKVTIFFLRKH